MSKTREVKTNTYESLKALYFSGKVKPSLNKIIIQLQSNSENLDLTLLACQCLVRTKDFDKLSSYADTSIKLDSKNPEGYYYKGIALHNKKGKEQDALKNFNEALVLDPKNIVYLKAKAITHLILFKDYHLPIKFAEKHRVKGEEILSQVITLLEQNENPGYLDFLTAGDVSIIINRKLDARKYYNKAVNAFDTSDESDQDRNIYKDIIKAQKACIKLIEKFSE